MSDQEVGQAILDAITAGGLLRISEPCDGPDVPHVFVWTGNAQEQLGAAARRVQETCMTCDGDGFIQTYRTESIGDDYVEVEDECILCPECDSREKLKGEIARLRAFVEAVAAIDEVGESVTCSTCGGRKNPRGRYSGVMGQYLCDQDCEGYEDAPRPSDLHPGERRSDYGYGWWDSRAVAEVVSEARRILGPETE